MEKVSGQPLGAFLKARIFDPLGMTRTALDDGREIVPHRAMGYDRRVEETPGYINTRTISMSVPFAAGAMRSTVPDLLTWGDALTHGRVLGPDSYREMTTPARLSDGASAYVLAPDGTRYPVSYGLGIAVPEGTNPRKLGHDGAIDGFTATLTIYPDQDVMVALAANTSPSEHLPIVGVIAAVEAELVEPAPGDR